MQLCQVSDAQLLIPTAHANLLCAEGNIKFTVHKADPTTRTDICSGAISQWNTWDSVLEQSSAEMDLFAGNSLPIARAINIYSYLREREREGCSQHLKTKNRDTWVTKTGTCLCSSNIFPIGGTQLKTNILLQVKCSLQP